MTDVPIQGAATGVADAERLRGGVVAPLDRGEREARGTRADGWWYRCGRDGEGDGDRDGGCSGCAENNGLTIAAWGQCAGHYIGCDHTGACARGWTESQPCRATTGSPVQCTVTDIVDGQGLGRRAGSSLLSRKGQIG